MKFENTEVFNFQGALRGMRNYFDNTVRRFDELNKIAFCDKRRK